MNIPQNIFCPMPFVTLDISSSGEISYCCESQFKLPPKSQVKVNELFNHESFKRDRALFRSDAIPIGCANCFKLESKGLASKRETEIDNLNHGLFGSIDKKFMIEELKFFSYRIGNNCNLTCIMCNSESSYKIGLENWRCGSKDSGNPPALRSNKIDYSSDFESLELLYVGGGEPLRSKEFKELLEHLINIEKTDITVSFNTNLSALPKSYVKLLKQFKTVYFAVSIDGYRESLEYIRYPLKWELLNKKLNELQKIDGFRCGIQYTVSALNISCLTRLIEYLANTWIGATPLEFNAHILNHPLEQNLLVLNDATLKKVSTQLQDFYDYLKNFDNIKVGRSIDNILNYINQFLEKKNLSEETRIKYREDLIKMLKAKDRIRGTNFEKAFPTLKKEIGI